MKTNNLENIIKRKLDAYHSDVDPKEIWDGIQKKRYPNRRKRRVFFMIAAALLLLLAAGIIMKMNNDNTSAGYDDNHPHVVDKVQEKSKLYNDKNIAKSEIKNEKAFDIKHSNENQDNHIANKNSKLTYINSPQRRKETKNVSAGFNNNNNNNIENNKINSNNENSNNIAFNDKNTTVIESPELEKDKITSENKNVLLYATMLKSEIKYLTITHAIQFTPEFKTFARKRKNNTKTYNAIEFSFSPNYVIQDYSLLEKDAKYFLRDKRDNEYYLEAFDVNLGFKKSLYGKFGFYTGLNYGQIDTKLDYAYHKTQDEEDSIVTKVIVNSVSDTLKLMERATVTKNYNIHEKIYNYRRYLRIPLLISYSGKYKRLFYEVRTGADINLITFNTGKAITPFLQTTTIDDTKSNMLRKKAIGDFHLDLRLAYALNKHYILTVGPQYKVSLRNLMSDEAGISIYNHSIGVDFGIQYKL